MKLVRAINQHMQGPAAAAAVFIEAAEGLTTERNWALFLSEDREVLGGGLFEASEGNEYSVAVPLVEIANKARVLGAKYVVMAHNHPPAKEKGTVSAQPSLGDLLVNESSRAELAKHHINLGADFIIGPNGDTTDMVSLMDTVKMFQSPLAAVFAQIEMERAKQFTERDASV